MEQRDLMTAKIDLLRVMVDAHMAGDQATKQKAEALYQELIGPANK